jgi:predicted permease
MVRRGEIGVRMALGARLLPITLPLVLEVVALAVLGAALGAPAAYWTNRQLTPTLGELDINFSLSITPDLRAASVAFIATLIAAVGAALLPVWSTRKVNLRESLQSAGRTSIRSHVRPRRSLLIAQLGLTFVFISIAGASLQGVTRSQSMLAKFHSDDVVALGLNPLPGGYKDLVPAPYYRSLLDRVSTEPAVETAAFSNPRPFSGIQAREAVMKTGEAFDPSHSPAADTFYVTGGFFDLMRIPFLDGQTFPPDGAEPAAILTESLARRLFPRTGAVGKYVVYGAQEPEKLLVTGVVHNVPLSDVYVAENSIIFLNYWGYRNTELWPTLLIRPRGPAATAIASVRRDIDGAGREYPIDVVTMREQVDIQLFQERVLAGLAAALAAIGLLLAIVGLYGLLSYYVASRSREIGLRVALGAQRREVLGLIVGESVRLIAMASVVAVPLAYVVLRIASHMLYDFGGSNPLILLASLAILMATALAASWSPCKRAMRVDPARALRME